MASSTKGLPSMTDKELVRKLCLTLPDKAKDELFLSLMVDRCLRWLGINSEEDFLEQVHRDIRKCECLKRGLPFAEYENRKTFFICPSAEGFSHRIRIKDRPAGHSLPRYYCEDCRKVYSPLTNTLLYKKGFDIVKWYTFIDCMMNGQTLGEISNKCNISIATANEWRLRLFTAVEMLQKDVRLSGVVEADETFIKINYSGKDTLKKAGVIRRARKRGHASPMADVHKDEVCIFCAVDNAGNCIAKITGIGTPSALELIQTAANSFDINNVNRFVTDGEKAMASFAKACHLPHLPLISQHKKHYGYIPQIIREGNKEYSVQHVNSLHSHLKRFLRNFKGVSTKYLGGYLSLFTYIYSHGKSVTSPDSFLDILRVLITPECSYTEKEMQARFEQLVYVPRINSNLSDFSKEQIALYAKYVEECDTNSGIKTELANEYGIAGKDVDTIIAAFEENSKLKGKGGLAYRWYRQYQQSLEEEEKRQAKQVTRNNYHRNVITDYTSGMSWNDICKKYGKTPQRIYQILKEHRNAGEVIVRARTRKKSEKKPAHPHKETQAERFYKMYEGKKKKHPKMSLPNISREIANETGANANYIKTAISKERIKRTGQRVRRVTPAETKQNLIEEYERMCKVAWQNNLSTSRICKMLSQKYKVKLVTVRAIVQKHYEDRKIEQPKGQYQKSRTILREKEEFVNAYAKMRALDDPKLSDNHIFNILSQQFHRTPATLYRWSAELGLR